VVLYAVTVALAGMLAGIVWNRVVRLPSYKIENDFRAAISEAGQTQIAATDVYFAVVGAVGGIVIGIIAWLAFHRLGWPVTVLACAGAGVAGLLARWVGEFIGPRDFEGRIARATTGEFVRIDFASHTWVTMGVWIAMAALVVLIGSLVTRSEWIHHVPESASTGS
jgi:branched-subunit amino acid ABC-type transport system permease component